MKANVRDQYDFEQPSPSQKPGFELFFSKKHKAWFFHANDVNGKPVLFSQAYQTAETAEKGMQSAWKNIEKGRIFKRPEEGQFFLALIAGNNQEVGRSQYFKIENEAENALSFLKQVVSSSNPMVSKEPEIQAVQELVAPAEYKSIRRYFRIYFYKNEDNELKGRIEDIADNASAATFQGLDTQTIMGFMREKLEVDFEDSALSIPESVEVSTPPQPAVAKAAPLQQAVHTSSVQPSTIRVVQVGTTEPQLSSTLVQNMPQNPLKTRAVDHSGLKLSIEHGICNRATPSVKLFMDLSDSLINLKGHIIGSELKALDADTNQSIRLQSEQTDESMSHNRIAFRFSPASLPQSGTYRFEATAWITGVNQEVVNLRGTCWAYFL